MFRTLPLLLVLMAGLATPLAALGQGELDDKNGDPIAATATTPAVAAPTATTDSPVVPAAANDAGTPSGAAAGPEAVVGFAFWLPGDPVVPGEALGLDFGPSPASAPPLHMETRTALFLAGNPKYLTAEDKARLQPAKDLVKAKRGDEAIAAYEALVGQVGQAEAEIGLTNIYLGGRSGVPQNAAKGLAWLERASVVAPPYFFHLGRLLYSGVAGQAASPQAAADAWSRGVRHGCGRCASAMLGFWLGERQGVTVSDADAFAYAVWAADLGSLSGLQDLQKVVDTLSDGPRRLDAAAQLAADARALAGTTDHRLGGLAAATFQRYRSGWVNANWADVHQMVKDGKGQAAIASTLGSQRFTDRQLGPFLAQFLSEAAVRPELLVGLGQPARRMLNNHALSAGVLSHAAIVAEQAADGRPELTIDPKGKFISGQHRFQPEEARWVADVAVKQGMDAAAVGQMVAQAQRSAHGDRLSAQARLCVETQLSKKRQIARTSQERAAIRDLIDTNSFMTNCSVKVSQALAANPGDPDLRRWHATIRAYQAKRAEGIAAIRAERAALLQRQANAEQARSSSTRMASPRSRAPGSRTTTKPCRWTTFKGTGGGRACVTE